MSIEDKQARSVFVGNIPHGTTEEQMKDYFSDVGNVLSFRIVYDRETGNPKGYGFAEYLDTEMAQTAIRNLNGREFSGRVLRVDKASSQADELRMIHQQTGGPPIENPYGEHVSPDKAPEAISRAVASLPPEQMFELMKQMKACIQNNPNEARTMLLNNPQLAYALLQAQVVMRIVDPHQAQALLHRKPDQIAPIMPLDPMRMPNVRNMPMMPQQDQAMIRQPPVQGPMSTSYNQNKLDVPSQPPQIPPAPGSFSSNRPEPMMDPRYPRLPQQINPSPQIQVRNQQPAKLPLNVTTQPQQPSGIQQISPGQNSISTTDQEKAALIMQVLQLTDAQIAMLPPEQRQSILVLKDQIAQRTGGMLPQI